MKGLTGTTLGAKKRAGRAEMGKKIIGTNRKV